MVALKVVAGLLGLTSATLAYCIVTGLNPFLRRCNPAICQNYALSAFHAHSVMQRGEGYCDYGALPGFLTFNVMKQPGERWQTAVKGCQLKNLLLPTPNDTGHTRVLLLGDSVDAHMAQQWCLLLEQPLKFSHVGIKAAAAAMAAAAVAAATNKSSSGSFVDAGDPAAMKNRDVLYHCRPSGPAAAGRSGSTSVGMFHLPGVHLAGPFHTGVKGNFLVRVPAALRAFNSTFGAPPDLVLIHSNFWDQSRMWEQRLPGYGHINKLMPDVVFSWSSNFSLLLSTTRELLPEDTLMATRTAAFPAFSANWLGRWGYIQQLNMAAVEVTRLHGLPVIDLGGMVFGLEPRNYLEDQHHPNKVVLTEAANIAMNLLKQHQKRLAAERRAAALQEQLGQQETAEGDEAAKEEGAGSSSGDGTGVATDQPPQEEQAPADSKDSKDTSAVADAGQEQQQQQAAAATRAGAEQQQQPEQPKQHSDAG